MAPIFPCDSVEAKAPLAARKEIPPWILDQEMPRVGSL
jgi:hypothetical protein